ncbi:MAG: hypothetical protein Tsb0020_37560 [Haliangiales bacterium]
MYLCGHRSPRLSLASRLALACAGLALIGCGDNLAPQDLVDATPPEPSPDAAPAADASPDAAPAVGVCAAPLALAGALADTVTTSGDTSTTDDSLPLVDLGDSCGPEDPDPQPPQQVVAYQVPGTGRVGLEFSLINDGTTANFDSLVQVRSDCAIAPTESGTCFDGVGFSEPRSRGTYIADGGDTLYLVITGDANASDSRVTEGAWSLDVYADTATQPTLTEASLRIMQTFIDGSVTGADAGADVKSVRLVAYNADGDELDTNLNGMSDPGDRLIFPLPNSDGQTSFSDSFRVDAFGLFYLDNEAVEVDISLLDRFGDESARLRRPVERPVLRGVGDSCDDATEFCAIDLACTADVCAVSQGTTDACAAAVDVPIATPTDTTTTAQASATLVAGDGAMTATCVESSASEAVFSVDVPAGAYDLIASTRVAPTGDLDTILYVRADCADPTTEQACNDDAFADGSESRVELRDVAAGTYTIVAEPYPFGFVTLPADVGVELSLRPVLTSGAACDVDEVENRCADGPCAADVCP